VGVFVLNLEAGVDTIGDHTRPIPDGRRRGRPSDPDGKEESDAVGPPEVEILSNHRFEEESPLYRPIEDLGETDLELVDRETVIVAGTAIGRWERPWKTIRPAVEKGLDVGGPERIAHGLEGDRIGTGEKPVSSASN